MAVRNSIKTISVEVSRYDEVGQILWILLNNQKQKIRIGAIYGPQENVTPNNELKLLYKTIADQIEIPKGKYQQVLMVGNFNVKIGNHIPGNKETVLKGGRQLKRIIEKYNLNIINANEHKCKGKWTREQGEERSVIDYVITSQEYMDTIKSMEIDEEKQYGLYKIECQNKQIKKTYFDHNAIDAIVINIDFISPKDVSRKKKVITRKGYKKYQTENSV